MVSIPWPSRPLLPHPPFLIPRPESSDSSWRLACFSKSTTDRSLCFFEPKVVDSRSIASCKGSEVDLGASFWKDSLVGKVVGLKPHIPTLKKLFSSKWKLKSSLEISVQSECLIFRFEDLEERIRILEAGPWFIAGHLLILRPWCRNIGGLDKSLSSIPIWIQLHGLPLEFWTLDSLSRIGSAVGVPLLADEHTVSRSKTSFARLCIEVTPLKPLPEDIWIDIEGTEIFIQKIIYEWRPKICSSCQSFFHFKEACKNVKTVEGVSTVLKAGTSSSIPRKNLTSSGAPKDGIPMPENTTSRGSALAPPGNGKLPLEAETGWTEVRRNKKNRKKAPEITTDGRSRIEVGGSVEIPCSGGIFVAAELPRLSSVSMDVPISESESRFFSGKKDTGCVSNVLQILPVCLDSPCIGVTDAVLDCSTVSQTVWAAMVDDSLRGARVPTRRNNLLPVLEVTLEEGFSSDEAGLEISADLELTTCCSPDATIQVPAHNSSFLNYNNDNFFNQNQPKSSKTSNQITTTNHLTPIQNPSPSALQSDLQPNPNLVTLSSRNEVELVYKEGERLISECWLPFKEHQDSFGEFEAESSGESIPPGFSEDCSNFVKEKSTETAIHLTEEVSESDEENNCLSSRRAQMIREKLGISIIGTKNADKAFADFCKSRQKESDSIRKKSVVPDASLKLLKQVGKKGINLKGECGRRRKN